MAFVNYFSHEQTHLIFSEGNLNPEVRPAQLQMDESKEDLAEAKIIR